MIPGQFNNRVLAERPNAARPDATHPPAPVFRPPHQTTKEESALMLEKLAAADGLSHASARAPPPAARIQELVDRVRVAEAAAAAQQARAVRAERERDDASRRLEDASRATWESDAGRLATDLAAANAEHAHRVDELQTRWKARLDEETARARRDAEAERDAALAKCGEAAADAARAEAATRECARLEDEKASLERAVRELASLNAKLAARVAANAVGALDARAVGLDFGALVPKLGAGPGKEKASRKGKKGGKARGVGGGERREGSRGGSRSSSRDPSPPPPVEAEERPASARRGVVTTTATPTTATTPPTTMGSNLPLGGGRRGWNPGGIPPRPIPDPPPPPRPGLPPPPSSADRRRAGVPPEAVAVPPPAAAVRRELFRPRAKIPSRPARGSVGTSVSRAAGGYDYAPSRVFGKRVGEETPRHVRRARDAARRAASSLRHATRGGVDGSDSFEYDRDGSRASFVPASRPTSAVDSPSGRVGMQLRDEFEALRREYGELLDAAAKGKNVADLSSKIESVILKLERKSAIIARLHRSDHDGS